jgi:hypothetical protein
VNFTDEARFYSQQTPHVTKDANFRLVQPRPPSVTLPRRQPSEDWRIAKTDERDYDSVGSYDQIKKPKQFVTQCKRTGKRIGSVTVFPREKGSFQLLECTRALRKALIFCTSGAGASRH